VDPDAQIADKAVAWGDLSPEDLAECLAEQREQRQEGLLVPLREVVLDRGLLSPERWAEIGAAPAPAPQELPETKESPARATVAETVSEGEPPPPREAGDLPATFGRYLVTGELGRGAMGVVYEALDPTSQGHVAIKVLLGARALEGAARERFLREAEAISQLSHPGIVRVLDHGDEGSDAYLVMELVRGRSLRDALAQDGPLEPWEAARIARATAEALEHAHARGVVHRDVKPANVLLETEGRVVITDFGLARRADDRTLTREGFVVGTPLYMPPEQARGARGVDGRADVYALGVTLYELLAGDAPWSSAPTDELMERILAGGVPRLESAPSDLADVIELATAADPRDRFPSAGALADDLGRFLRGEPVHAKPPGPWQMRWRRLRRRRDLQLLVVAGLLTGAAFGVTVHTQRVREADTLVLEALRLRGSGSQDQARANLDRALAIRPTHVDALRTRGELLREAGDLEAALQDAQTATASAPEDARARILEGLLLLDLRRSDPGSERLREGLELGRAQRATEDASYREGVARLGELELEQGNLARAQADLEEAVRLDPERVRARILLARALFLRGRVAGAAEAASEALHRDREALEALELRGRAYRRLRRTTRAFTDLDAAAARPQALMERGLLRFEFLDLKGGLAGAFDDAAANEDLRQALEAEGLTKDQRALANVTLAWLGSLQGKGRIPMIRLDEALREAPSSRLALLTRGLARARAGDARGAKQDLEAAREVESAGYAARVGLARLAVSDGDNEAARALLDEAIALAPKRTTAYGDRYRLRLRQKDPAAGRDRKKTQELAQSPPTLLSAGSDPLQLSEQAVGNAVSELTLALEGEGRHLERALAWTRRALAFDPENLRAATLLPRLLYLLGDPKRAAGACKRALSVDPLSVETRLLAAVTHLDFAPKRGAQRAQKFLDSALSREGLTPGQRARLTYQLARVRLAQKQPKEALVLLDRALQERQTHCAAGLRMLVLRDLGRSEQELDGALDLCARLFFNGARETTRARLFAVAGARMRLQGKQHSPFAGHLLTRAIESDPHLAFAWRQRAQTRWHGSPEQFPRALVDDYMAAELRPNRIVGFTELEARAHRFQGVLRMVAASVNEAVHDVPHLPAAPFVRGYLAFTLGDYVNAERWYDRAVKASRGRFYFSLTLRGAARLRLKRPEEALVDFAAAEKLYPDLPLVKFWRACVHATQGEVDVVFDALESCRKQGALFPNQIHRTPELAHLMDHPRMKALLAEQR
jgi:tetratricopeptide (TPR) repeat protein